MIHKKKARDLKIGDCTPWYEVYEILNPSDENDENDENDKRAEVMLKVKYNDGGLGIRCWDNGDWMVDMVPILTSITVTDNDGAREI